jgi:hypothetical protein
MLSAVTAASMLLGGSSATVPKNASVEQLHDLIRPARAVANAILERPRLGGQLLHEVRR